MNIILYHHRLGRVKILSGPDSNYKVRIICVGHNNRPIDGTEMTLPFRALRQSKIALRKVKV